MVGFTALMAPGINRLEFCHGLGDQRQTRARILSIALRDISLDQAVVRSIRHLMQRPRAAVIGLVVPPLLPPPPFADPLEI